MPQIFIVNAFCHHGQGGNGAGVVPHADGLTRQQKQTIAAQVGLSETAFVSPSAAADFKLEYFTPVAEVELCGHATIATFTLLHQQGLKPGTYSIETLSGILQIEVSADGTIWMQQCLPSFLDSYAATDFEVCLPGFQPHPALPIQAVSTGLPDIMLPLASVEALEALQPDFAAMAALNERQGVMGIHAFALTGNSSPIAICRNFAPRYGIDEESATGTSNCALACYLHRHHQPLSQYRFLQGISMGCTSAIEVKLHHDHDILSSVYVGGRGSILR